MQKKCRFLCKVWYPVRLEHMTTERKTIEPADIEGYILRVDLALSSGASVYSIARTFRKEGVSVGDTFLFITAGRILSGR